jgi:signal recognition particle GTPase
MPLANVNFTLGKAPKYLLFCKTIKRKSRENVVSHTKEICSYEATQGNDKLSQATLFEFVCVITALVFSAPSE